MKRKYFLLSIVVILVILLSGCTLSSSEPADKLTIYSVNDFHGAIQEDEGKYGISRLGNYIMQAKQENPNEVVVVSAGDMFQGTGISNYNKGLNVIEMMNIIGFDAMTIGNHEFDWGIDTILNYRDGDNKNGEADFPFLAANILYKDSNLIPENIEPYTIIERGGLKIGIIGYIGYGLEDDIATKMIEDYYFALPVNAVEPFVVELRTEKNCDVVIAVGHDASDANNQALANLTDDARIDAIVNGHLHLDTSSYVTSVDGRKVPVVQAGSSGEYVGVISFDVDPTTKTLSNPVSATVLMDGSKQTNKKLNNYVSDLVKETEPYFGRILAEAGEKVTVSAVRKWAPSVVQKYMNVEIAFVNNGGIRSDAFPIAKDENVDVAKVYQIMPFDNIMKTCMLKGSDVLKALNNSSFMYSNTVSKSGGLFYINGELLDENKYYNIAAVDYIFDKPENPFLKGENIDNTGILYRDILIDGIEEAAKNNGKWFPSK